MNPAPIIIAASLLGQPITIKIETKSNIPGVTINTTVKVVQVEKK